MRWRVTCTTTAMLPTYIPMFTDAPTVSSSTLKQPCASSKNPKPTVWRFPVTKMKFCLRTAPASSFLDFAWSLITSCHRWSGLESVPREPSLTDTSASTSVPLQADSRTAKTRRCFTSAGKTEVGSSLAQAYATRVKSLTRRRGFV